MPMHNQDQQAALIDMLREGFVLTTEEIVGIFLVRDADKYIKQVMERTQLDIYQGKIMIKGHIKDVYYMISDIKPECPGLDNMTEAFFDSVEDAAELKTVEYHKGYYLMWICPNSMNLGPDDNGGPHYEECGQFHKVDLGDVSLTEIRTVRCIKCGNRYQIKPQAFK